ncbi:unnamed protein product [Symbiodinium microadriaticum]|nr:unnamed protein product [Symbiodinium microadriaticum]
MKKVVSALALTLIALSATPAFAEGDPKKGERVFKKCKACHQVGEGAKHGIGPMLNGIMGKQVGTLEGFKYSKAMREAGEEGMTWTEENMSAYLEKPRKFIPKNRMTFAGLKKEKDRDNVIAYLKQYSE